MSAVDTGTPVKPSGPPAQAAGPSQPRPAAARPEVNTPAAESRAWSTSEKVDIDGMMTREGRVQKNC